MIYGYYVKHEQYKDYRRESEKERIIRQIQKSNREKSSNYGGNQRREGSSWIEKISWAIREARGISAH